VKRNLQNLSQKNNNKKSSENGSGSTFKQDSKILGKIR